MSSCATCMRDVGAAAFCPFCGAAAPATGSADDPYVGQTVAKKYLLHDVIGRGGMGIVYAATHLSLDRPVAIKMLNRALLADPTVVARFHREARAASRLNHPNSISIIDFGQTDDGTLFMALEFLPGRTLGRVIIDEFPVLPRRVVKIGSQILAALTEAHALGILHCDIKPENVMLETRHDETDIVKVLDFGIAKLRDGLGATKLTREGMTCGTPGYASPEQARGEELDARSDLYSVGVLLYELVSGKLPYEASSPGGLVAKMLVEPPVPLRRRRPDLAVAPELEAVIMRALATDRQLRFPSADAFRRALVACGDTGEQAIPPPRAQATAVLSQEPGVARGAPRGRPATPPSPRPAGASSPAARQTPGQTPRHTPGHTPRHTPGGTGRHTPRHHAATPAPRSAVRETTGALAVILASVAGAVLLGAGVWFGLSWLGGAGAGSPRSVEPLEGPVTTPATPAAPVPPAPAARPVRAPPPTTPPLTAKPGASGLEGVVTVLGMPGARIMVDGRQAGQSPRELRLPAGTHRIQVTHPTAGNAEETLEVVAGERKLWTPSLAR
jgi:serine/threonine-protein kinase